MVTDLLTGAWYVVRGATLLRKPGVRHFVLVPLGISALITIVFAVITMHYVHSTLGDWLPLKLAWLTWILEPLADLLLLGLSTLAAALLANIIAAPFNADLARSVLAILTPKQDNVPKGKHWTAEAAASVSYEIQRLWYGIKRLLPGLTLALVPGLAWLVPIVSWSVAAWTLALQYLDYPMALQHFDFHEQRSRASEQRTLIFGFGAAVALLHSLPLLNLLAMPVAVAGATALWKERMESAPGQTG